MTQALQRSRDKAAKQKKQTEQPTSEATIAQRVPETLASLEQPADPSEASEAEATVDEPENSENSAEPEVSAEPVPKKSSRKRAARSQPKDTSAMEPGMQVICSQSQFHDALAIASCAAPAKPSHPVLANVLIVADANAQQVHLTVTDLSMTMQASFEAQVLLGSEITVPVEMLSGMVKQFPTGNITLNSQAQVTKPAAEEEQAIKTCSITLADTNGKYEIRGIPAEDFPPIATLKAAPVSLPTNVLREGLKGVLYAISTDETKRILTGVYIQIGQNALKFIATDGHRVAIAELSTEGISRKRRKRSGADEPTQFPISGKALKELIRNLADSVDSIQLLYDAEATRASFAWQDIILSCQCIEGQYPDCEQLLARYSFDREVVLEKSGLLKALERLSVLTDKKERGIQFRFDGATQQIHLSIEREFGKGDETISAHIPTDMTLEIQFNLKYLGEAVKAIPSSAIKMHLKQPDYPVMLVPAGDFNNPELEMEMRHFLFPLYKQPE
ncbi:DNA polymerase III subunit beta [Alkalinema sp. FACHB-956]|uniref:DNA polymerase III subunit beta n=1 Tax=Alkalinema sp. FACHB-956 TaxID=2692768 RepID=UPI0018EF454A|nr:DNA polymerase III subunit beta [Alkalinema sp. FACHB-956]